MLMVGIKSRPISDHCKMSVVVKKTCRVDLKSSKNLIVLAINGRLCHKPWLTASCDICTLRERRSIKDIVIQSKSV